MQRGKKKTLTETCTHSNNKAVFKRRGSEGILLSAVLLSGGAGPLDSRAHISYLL